MWEVFLDSEKCFGILGSILDSGKCFGFWEVFCPYGPSYQRPLFSNCSVAAGNIHRIYCVHSSFIVMKISEAKQLNESHYVRVFFDMAT